MVKGNIERDFPAVKKNDLCCLFNCHASLIKKSNVLVAIYLASVIMIILTYSVYIVVTQSA